MNNPVKGLSLKLYRCSCDGTPPKKTVNKVEKMKELNLKIKTCQDCPYAIDASPGVICSKNNNKRICPINEYIGDKGIPDWCPLDDAKDQGVKVGCTAMVVRDGKILLGLRGDECETAKNEWAYPGGRMDYGEDPLAAVIREVKEETAINLLKENVGFATWKNEFFPENEKHYVSLVFFALEHFSDPKVVEPTKCKEWKWFDPEEIPENTFWACKENIDKYKDQIKSNWNTTNG